MFSWQKSVKTALALKMIFLDWWSKNLMHKHTFMFILFMLAQDKRTNTDDLVYEQPCLFIWLKQIKSSISGSCFEPPGFRIKQFYYDVTFLLGIITKRRKSPGNVMHCNHMIRFTAYLQLQQLLNLFLQAIGFSFPVFLYPVAPQTTHSAPSQVSVMQPL